MNTYKTPNLSDLIAVAGIISIVSLFIVLPYTIGYFTYFQYDLMSLFSITDYYQFSAFPLIMIFAYGAFVVFVGRFRLFRAPGLSHQFRLAAVCVGILLSVSWGAIMVSMLFALAIGFALAMFSVVIFEPVMTKGRLLIILLLLSQGFLFCWGMLVASGYANSRDRIVTVKTKEGEVHGTRLFLGNQSALLKDEASNIVVVRLDNGH